MSPPRPSLVQSSSETPSKQPSRLPLTAPSLKLFRPPWHITACLPPPCPAATRRYSRQPHTTFQVPPTRPLTIVAALAIHRKCRLHNPALTFPLPKQTPTPTTCRRSPRMALLPPPPSSPPTTPAPFLNLSPLNSSIIACTTQPPPIHNQRLTPRPGLSSLPMRISSTQAFINSSRHRSQIHYRHLLMRMRAVRAYLRGRVELRRVRPGRMILRAIWAFRRRQVWVVGCIQGSRGRGMGISGSAFG